jgi:hypothetical protein
MGKQKASSKRVGQLPELELLATCDAVSRDPSTKKASLYGLFDSISVEKLPTVAVFSLYAKLFGGSGSHDIAVRVTGPDGKPTEGPVDKGTLDCHPDQGAELSIHMLGFPIKKTGTYQLALHSGSKMLGRPCKIRVSRRKKKG